MLLPCFILEISRENHKKGFAMHPHILDLLDLY